jgi:magnesium transporter
MGKRRKTRNREFQRRTPPGAPPGRVVSLPDARRGRIYAFSYGPDGLEERELARGEEARSLVGKRAVTWINVDGLADAETVQQVGQVFALHPLALEDVVHVHQRAKVEDFERHLFLVARMVRVRSQEPGAADPSSAFEVVTEQVSIFVGENFVVTFQEEPLEDCFDPLRQRLRQNGGQLRLRGPDFLAYALLDALTDSYFPVIDACSEELDRLDDELTTSTRDVILKRIHDLRAQLLVLRRAAWPLREMFANLLREDRPQITAETRIYLRDCYDHTIQIIDVLETYREIGADLREYYFSSIGQRTNDIMRVLTIISTIFIPLSFIAGVWGMNFEPVSRWNMPELRWEYGYPFAWSVMAVVVAALVFYFWRKGWLRK